MKWLFYLYYPANLALISWLQMQYDADTRHAFGAPGIFSLFFFAALAAA